MWELFRGDRLAATLGIRLDDWGPGWAAASWTPTEEQQNFAGAVHGGALFTFGDVVFAVACNSWGRQAVALTVDTHFLGAVVAGEQLSAKAVERSRTRRTGSYHLDVHAGDRHVASLHAMAHRTSRWHLGEDAWPHDWRSLT
jgi:acyl-CoA thioesterase